jgi:hypothetical protein
MGSIKNLIVLIEKARSEKRQKSGAIAYWIKDGDKFILDYVTISFLKKDRKFVKEILGRKELEPGFLFWANSEDGEKFYEENYEKIVTSLNTQQIKPWLNYEYEIKKPNEKEK